MVSDEIYFPYRAPAHFLSFHLLFRGHISIIYTVLHGLEHLRQVRDRLQDDLGPRLSHEDTPLVEVRKRKVETFNAGGDFVRKVSTSKNLSPFFAVTRRVLLLSAYFTARSAERVSGRDIT